MMFRKYSVATIIIVLYFTVAVSLCFASNNTSTKIVDKTNSSLVVPQQLATSQVSPPSQPSAAANNPSADSQTVRENSASNFMTGLAILISCMTILIAVITGIAFTLSMRASKDIAEFKELSKKYKSENDSLRLEMQQALQAQYAEMIDALKYSVFQSGQLEVTKTQLHKLLNSGDPAPKPQVYPLLQKSVTAPDFECISLYARALASYEADIDIIRIVRNGLTEFTRNPKGMVPYRVLNHSAGNEE